MRTTLKITQEDNYIELDFDDTTEASAMVEHLIPYASRQTKFEIKCEVEDVKGERQC